MELTNLSAQELRKVATTTYGIKGAAKHSKATLLEMCQAIEAERVAKAEAVTKKAAKGKPAKRGGKCTMPGCTRPQDRTVIGPELCTPHLEQADHENNHQDGHEHWTEDECWVCKPALDRSAMKATTGTTRAGMRMHVTSRASGAEKAEQIKAQVLALAADAACRIDVSKKVGVSLVIGLDGLSIRLVWNVAGPYAYDRTSIERDGRKPSKVRNASAALKAIAAHAEARPVAEPQMAEAA